jgi:hypothetical protein
MQHKKEVHIVVQNLNTSSENNITYYGRQYVYHATVAASNAYISKQGINWVQVTGK